MNHGIKRGGTISEKEKEESLKRIEAYQALLEKFQEKKKAEKFDEEGLEVAGKILEQNTDFYSCWNFRRKVLMQLFQTKTKEEIEEILKKELAFSEKRIAQNTKSYWVWFHRKTLLGWLNERGLADWKREIYLCSKLLALDERNFHCWGYRRWVAQEGKVTDESELQFTKQKIEENFSNYSAWHQRSLLLFRMNKTQPELVEAIAKELELVHNAFFTKPEDQSGWIYFRWLLGVVPPTLEVIKNELDICDQLLELEPKSKWTKLTKVFLYEKMRQIQQVGSEEEEEIKTKIANQLKELVEIDPTHANYYLDFVNQKTNQISKEK
eukprot:TRINITY_DN4306_c0_g1_i1.p1 TRINITY_DN4306_c0_g1~~TRINITY_DN4306_c0_g1_i1.p1  ORF type:complete len:324 (-),score=103.23 TRINITY_DN4306_c0_g1_i1:84-1055(-)